VELLTLRIVEVQISGNVAFEGRDDEIDRRVTILRLGDGSMHHTAQHEQPAADAAAGTEHENEHEQRHGFPAGALRSGRRVVHKEKSDAADDGPLQLPERGELVDDIKTVATAPKGSRDQHSEPGTNPALAK